MPTCNGFQATASGTVISKTEHRKAVEELPEVQDKTTTRPSSRPNENTPSLILKRSKNFQTPLVHQICAKSLIVTLQHKGKHKRLLAQHPDLPKTVHLTPNH